MIAAGGCDWTLPKQDRFTKNGKGRILTWWQGFEISGRQAAPQPSDIQSYMRIFSLMSMA